MWVDEGSCIHGHPDTSSDYCRACEQDTGSESARPDAATLREQIRDAVDYELSVYPLRPPRPRKITDAVMAVLAERNARPDAATLREQIAAALEGHQVEFIDHEVGFDCGCNEYGTLHPLPFRSDGWRHQADAVMAVLAEHGLVERPEEEEPSSR